MFSITYITIILLFEHFVSDFLFQDRKTAENKSSKFSYMFFHCIIYTSAMTTFFIPFINLRELYPVFLIFLTLFISHIIVDSISSRLTTIFYKYKTWYLFFATIGFDQFLHTSVIIILIEQFITNK